MTDITRPISRLLLVVAVALALPLAVPRAAYGQSYWFEDYLKAVRLVDHKQMSEASVLISRLIDQHPVPLSGVRIYGDTYVEYFPYYQRARIQLSRGDIEGAAQSLDICEAFGAMIQTQRGERQIQQLRHEIAEIRRFRRAAGTGAD